MGPDLPSSTDSGFIAFPNRVMLRSILACLGILSFLEYRILYLLHYPFLGVHLEIANGILSGHPHWKSFQSRLFGPQIVFLMSQITHFSFAACYQIFCFSMVCIANGTAYYLFSKKNSCQSQGWTYTVGLSILVVAFQDNAWFYLWDYVDLTFMLIFAWAIVVGNFPFFYLVILFFLEVFNRESAQFVALWIAIDAVQIDFSPTAAKKFRIDPVWLVTGITLGAVGLLSTRWLREKLCIDATGISLTGVREIAGQMWLLPHTLDLLRSASLLTTGTVTIFLSMLVYLLWSAWVFLGARAWKIVLLVGAMIVANLCFSIIIEIRVWLSLLPVAVCLVYVKNHVARPTSSLSNS